MPSEKITLEQLAERARGWKFEQTMLSLRYVSDYDPLKERPGQDFPSNGVFDGISNGELWVLVSQYHGYAMLRIPVDKLVDVNELTPIAAVHLLNAFRSNMSVGHRSRRAA